jgi:hypothetical protein
VAMPEGMTGRTAVLVPDQLDGLEEYARVKASCKVGLAAIAEIALFVGSGGGDFARIAA